MATKEQDSSMLKKEKVTTPLNSHANVKQGSLKQKSSGSTDKKPIPSGKPVPNYLKPTISSRPESFKYVKKTGQEDATQKATLQRRRSFDRPPSASRIQRSLISPDPKERAASRDRSIAVRPAATSSKTGSSPKPVSERNSRSLKPVKSQGPTARTIKRSSSPSGRTALSKRNGSSSTISSKDPSDDDISQTLDLKISQESDKESLLDDSVEALNFESEVPELSPDAPKTEDKEHVDAADTQVNNDEDEKLKPSKILTVSGHQEAHVEELESELHEEESEKQQGEKENTNSESANGHHEEGNADETKVEGDKDKAEENVNENVVSTEEPADEKKQEDINQVDEGSEEIKSKDGEVVVASSVEEVKPEGEADNGEKKRLAGQGKKESPAAYNDVIEETKNKLLERRKNKVKALVGAFETVIDYESGSK